MTAYDKDELLRKFREGRCSEQELAILEAWYADWNMGDHISLSEAELNKAETRMRKKVMGRISAKKFSIWPKVAIAASLALAVAVGIYVIGLRKGESIIAKNSKTETGILPGKVGATLTLADGKEIRLGQAKTGALAQQGSISVQKSKDGQLTYVITGEGGTSVAAGVEYNSLTTARGETYRVQLPDNSLVWLNAESRISFPVNLKDAKERTVTLNGEAYFEIAKDKLHPFVVKTVSSKTFPAQEIRVLGTHFNINSYSGESQSQITLLEGSISLSNRNGISSHILKPGQQAAVDYNGTQIAAVDAESAVAWKNGYFYFDKAEVGTVMNQIARWYNVDVAYEAGIPKDHISGKVHRNASLSEALQILGYLDIKYSISGRIITIRP